MQDAKSFFQDEVFSTMKLSKFLLFLLLAASLPAMAQTGLYTEFSTTHISATGEPRMYGVTFGGYVDKQLSKHLDFLSLGPDFRLSLQSGATGNSAYPGGGPAQSLIGLMVGPRLAFHLPILPIHPYIEGLIGGGDSQIGELIPDSYQNSQNTPPGTAIDKNGGGTMVWQVVGGLDMKVFPHVDWRVVEYSYGNLFASAGGTPDYGLTTLSTGIVVRLP